MTSRERNAATASPAAGYLTGDMMSLQGRVTKQSGGGKFRITFLDTPGMDNRGKMRDGLAKVMGKSISGAVAECDVICYVLDAADIRDQYIQKINNLKGKKPIIAVVNKTDKTNFEKLYPHLAKLNAVDCVVVPVSAKTGENLDVLVREIVKLLPEVAAEGVDEVVFACDEYTDQTVRSMCAEIIRGQLINHLRQEIPHGVAVQIVKFNEKPKEIDIDAEIICAKPSHKPIIIGRKGAVLKAAGIESRRQIGELTGKHIRLGTHVLVREGWRDGRDVKRYLGLGNT